MWIKSIRAPLPAQLSRASDRVKSRFSLNESNRKAAKLDFI